MTLLLLFLFAPKAERSTIAPTLTTPPPRTHPDAISELPQTALALLQQQKKRRI